MFGNISMKDSLIKPLFRKITNKIAAYLLKTNFNKDTFLRNFTTAGF